MNRRARRPFKCRCGRLTNQPEVVRSMILCAECAFDEQYGVYVAKPGRLDPADYYRPKFAVRKVS